MMLTRAFALALALALPVAGLPFHAALAGDRTVDFAESDPAMNAAIDEARKTLPRFLRQAFDGNGNPRGNAMLKVALPRQSGGGNEVIWVSNIARLGGESFSGQLANAPNDLGALKLGSKVQFSEAQIADWGMNAANGKLLGHYTTRAIVPRLSGDQRAQIEAILANPPLPPEW